MAIGTPVGSAFLEVQPQLGAGFQAAIAGKINPIMGAAAGVAGGVLAGGLAAGFAAFKIGETFDEAFDQIRVQTGATGDVLAGLQDDFKAVFQSVPTDAALAGDAIATISQRLGLTGEPLQALSQQFLELSRLTGTDLTGNIENVSRAFSDWNVSPVDEGTQFLDQMFRASQATGISVDALSQSMVRFGAPLRQLGFNFQESTALIANFEKEGVNADLVLGSMRIALGKMARAGEPAQETLARVTDEIKNAGSTSEANAIALELFGARAGPDMAAAIREGRFEVAELVNTISNGSDTIIDAGKDTQDFAERWQMFKNKVMVALEPIATRVFNGIGNLVDALAPKVESFITNTLVPAIDRFAQWWDQNGPRIMDIARQVFSALTLGFRTVIGVVQTVIGWFSKASGSTEGVKSAFASIAGGIQTAFSTILGIVQPVIEGVISVFQNNSEKIGGIVSTIGDVLGGLGDIITAVFNHIRDFWAEWGDEIMALIGNAINTVVGIIEGIVQVIKGVVDIIAGILTGDWTRVWEGLKNIVGGVFNAIKSIITGAINQVLVFFGGFITKAQNTVRTGLEKLAGFFRELPGKILDFLKELPGRMLQLGKDLIDGILKGLGDIGTTLFNKLKDGIAGAIKRVGEFFGIHSASTYTLNRLGLPLGQGVVAGYEEGMDPRELLATTRHAIDAITLAARPALAAPTVTRNLAGELAGFSAGSGVAGGPAIENVNFYDTREKPAEESLQEAGLKVAVMLNLRK